MGIPVYEGNLDVEELLDYIRALDKYFNYEDVEDEKKVNHVVTRLKGHVALWCNEQQDDMLLDKSVSADTNRSP
jgi:hypothetical protein